MMAAIEAREEGIGWNRGGWWGRENIVSTKRYVRSVADRVVSGHRGAGRCMYVHGKDECDVLWQMIPMRIDMVHNRLG